MVILWGYFKHCDGVLVWRRVVYVDSWLDRWFDCIYADNLLCQFIGLESIQNCRHTDSIIHFVVHLWIYHRVSRHLHVH